MSLHSEWPKMPASRGQLRVALQGSCQAEASRETSA
jgi:hypothetical protein